MAKPKLHELLAIEGDHAATSTKILEETLDTFSKRVNHFRGSVRSTNYFDEQRAENENTVEHDAMTTTVSDKANYMVGAIARHIDTALQKDMTNLGAVADLKVGDTVIAKDVPATFLLRLEHQLKRLRGVYESIPTLEPGLEWEEDTENANTFRVHEKSKFRTEKVEEHKVIVPATDHHPAQVSEYTKDVRVARIEEVKYSGMISPLAKSMILGRLDELTQAVKKARQRANAIEVSERQNLGKALFSHIHGDEV